MIVDEEGGREAAADPFAGCSRVTRLASPPGSRVLGRHAATLPIMSGSYANRIALT